MAGRLLAEERGRLVLLEKFSGKVGKSRAPPRSGVGRPPFFVHPPRPGSRKGRAIPGPSAALDQGERTINVRFGALSGHKSDIVTCPLCANRVLTRRSESGAIRSPRRRWRWRERPSF